jgi:hypothetical protein
MLTCLVLTACLWWDAQVDHYTGLPINTIGQILGDLLTAGLVAPLVYRRKSLLPRPRLRETIARVNSPAARYYAITSAFVPWSTQAEHVGRASVGLSEYSRPCFAMTILVQGIPAELILCFHHTSASVCSCIVITAEFSA